MSQRPASPRSPQRHEQLMEQFDAAVDLDPAARQAFLDELRARDRSLASELESLLRYEARSGPFLEQPLAHLARLSESAASTDTGGGSDGAPEAGHLVAGRYRIERVLGRGGGGTVCRARDTTNGDVVAVKFLRDGGASEARRAMRFRREFRAVARLDHPGCVRVFAEGVEGERRYIVMEYVAGGDLEKLVGAPSDLLLAVLVRLAVALDHVHSRQIVHRDLKPSNVLLAGDDPPTPRLADFGIALLRDDTWQSETGALIGTVDYLSPEQVQGRPADPRSDLYAFGCIVFRLWTGRPPFLGDTYARLKARCEQAPPSLAQLAPSAPPGLDAITQRLLATNPTDRPQSALEVAAALAQLLVASHSPLASGLLAATTRRADGAFLYRPDLVGRSAERRSLELQARAMAAGAPDAPALMILCADGGVGKTLLGRTVQRALVSEGFWQVTVSVPASAPGPLAPFPELRAALDALSASRGLAPAPAEGSATPDARRFNDDGQRGLRQETAALVEQLRRQHAVTPLVVVLEDLHHGAQGTFALLAEVVRQLAQSPGPRPALLGTMRPEGRAALSAAASGQSVHWLDLSPLDAAGIEELAAAMLGVRGSHVPAALSELLMVESDGNPLLAQSALRALVDRGALRRTDGGWKLDDGQTVARSARSLLVGRLSSLSAPARRVLEVAAAVGRRFDAELLAAASGDDEDTVQDALDEALRAALIRPSHREARQLDAFEFEHIRFAEVLHDDMDAAARAACHAALGRALEQRGAPAAARARHHTLGGEPLAAFRALRAAGHEALRGYDHPGAERYFREALARAEGLPAGTLDLERDRADCREGLADALLLLDRVPEAVALLAPAPSDGAPLPPEARADAARRQRKLGLARMRSGDTVGARAALEGVLVALGDALPRGRFALLLRAIRDAFFGALRRLLSLRPARPPRSLLLTEAALVHRELGQLFRWMDLERSVAHHIASARAAERLAAPDLQVDAIASIAMALAFVYDGTASVALGNLARRMAHSSGDRVGFGRMLVLQGGIDIIARNQHEIALQRLEEGIGLMQASGDRMLHAWALSWRGWAGIFAGRFDSALHDFNRAHAIALALQIDWLVADSASGRCLIDCVQGRFEASERAARALLASNVRLALPAIEALAIEILGGAAFLQGRPREGLAGFARARALYEQHHLERGWGYLVYIEEIEALLEIVDDEGPDAVPDLRPRILANAQATQRHLGRLPLYRGCGLVMRGVYQARSGRPREARELFARGLASRPEQSETYVDAWVLWRIAFERHRLGDPPAQTAPLLTRVEQIFERARFDGMKPWLARQRRIQGV